MPPEPKSSWGNQPAPVIWGPKPTHIHTHKVFISICFYFLFYFFHHHLSPLYPLLPPHTPVPPAILTSLCLLFLFFSSKEMPVPKGSFSRLGSRQNSEDSLGRVWSHHTKCLVYKKERLGSIRLMHMGASLIPATAESQGSGVSHGLLQRFMLLSALHLYFSAILSPLTSLNINFTLNLFYN